MGRAFTRIITTPAAARSPREWNRPFVSLLSDWGVRDPSPAICRGVVAAIAPDATVVDISHEVDKYNVRHGALLLWCALPFLPIGSHVAVVDPGVGTSRRPIAIETGRGDYLVGPDNGLLLPGAERLGGVVRAHVIENAAYRLPVVSSTFHGRDLFSPAGAHLAAGVPLEQIGPPIDVDSLVALDWPQANVRYGEVELDVIYVDTFGNVKLSGLGADLEQALGTLTRGEELVVEVVAPKHKTHSLHWANTFGEVEQGEAICYEDSYGRLCIAVNQGNAAKKLGLVDGASLLITRPGLPALKTGEEEPDEAADDAPDADEESGAHTAADEEVDAQAAE